MVTMPHSSLHPSYPLSVNEVNDDSNKVIDQSKPVGPELFRARTQIKDEVLRILKERYSGGKIPEDMYSKIASFAIQLESALYQNAKSFAEYSDISTLKARIKQIAIGINSARTIPTDGKQYVPLPNQPSHLRESRNKSDSMEYNSSAVRQQIQRILLLRHASRCQYKNGNCPRTTHCGALKDLWNHISSCTDRQCQYRHCVSSRYILSHYSKCDSSQCPVCVPVRSLIKGSSVGRKRSMSATELYDRESKVARTNLHQCATTVSTKDACVPPQPLYLDHGIGEKFTSILHEILRRPYADIFATPVDEQGLDLTDYHEVVTSPMDLGSVLCRLREERFYQRVEQVVSDVHLTFDNAMLYNGYGTDVYKLAETYKKLFDFLCQQQIWSLMQIGELEKCDLSSAMSKS